ncbi:MAG TPA: ABC transporter permease [Terriglobia bacterium]|nr:ABC transporter permease [Terriglobia bacterium]
MHARFEDLNHSLRQLGKSPGLAVVAGVALALGISGSTAIFSVVNGVLLRPLPYPEPEQLMTLYERTPEFSRADVSYPNFQDWRRYNQSFSDMAALRGGDFVLTGMGESERLLGEWTSASLFSVLDVRPQLGVSFPPGSDVPGAAPVVLLSYALWQRRFGSDPKLVGKALTLNGKSYTVLGILPADFGFRPRADLYVPIGHWDNAVLNNREIRSGLRVVGRLKPGVSPAAAQAEMDAIARRLATEFPKADGGRGITVVPMRDDITGNVRPTLLLLFGAVGFVLLIACANVANLLLARSTARRREFAIRTALGASRWRVVRQLLTESVLLALTAGGAGLLLAVWGTHLVLAALPASLPRRQEVGLDLNVLLFTLLVSIVTGILFGLAPAFQGSRVNPQEALKEGARGAAGGRHRAERVFVALQVGLALVLLEGAGLMMQSIWRLWRVDPGFDPHNILTMQIALSPDVVGDPPEVRIAYRGLLERVRATPGVQAAAITQLLPLSESDSEVALWPGRGPEPPPEQVLQSLCYFVTPDYPRVMSLPLLRGRFFDDRDNTSRPHAVVIDSVLAHDLLPGEEPLGRQITMEFLGQAQIIGVVGHVKHWGLDTDDTAKVRNELYFPFWQVSDEWIRLAGAGLTLALRTAPDPRSLTSAVRHQVGGTVQDQPAYNVQTMDEMIARSVAERRFALLLLSIFASTALILAAVGVYGVMSYSVTRRTQELGVRMALGATSSNVLKLVVKEGMTVALVGMAMGGAAAAGLARLMSSLLYGVHPADPLTLTTIAVALAAVCWLATYFPARRATRVDPLVALRCE